MPKSSKPIVFLAFSNDENRPLGALAKERTAIRNALEKNTQCEVIIEAAATLEDIFKVFSARKNHNRIAVFHYAGHANGSGLHVVNTDGANKISYASGLAKLFGMQKNLQLVFLNACSTEAQVKLLKDQNIPNIIATSEDVKDIVAQTIAATFYAALAENKGIEEAFNYACSIVEAETPKGKYRHLGNEDEDEEKEKKLGPPWKMFFDGKDWRLTNFQPINNPFKIFLAYSKDDKGDKIKLAKQLKLLKRRGYIDVFDEAEVQLGKVSKEIITHNLNTSQIILLFVTENLFFDETAEELIDEAIERYENDDTILVPVYIRECDIKGEKFEKLEGLPRKEQQNGETIRFVSQWDNEDQAYYKIAVGLRELIEQLKIKNS